MYDYLKRRYILRNIALSKKSCLNFLYSSYSFNKDFSSRSTNVDSYDIIRYLSIYYSLIFYSVALRNFKTS